jgi:hypothetical protein
MTSPPSTDRSARSSNRSELRRALLLNAVGKPLNALLPAGLVVAGALAGVSWLWIVALVCWLALAGLTFFDEREAARVGERVRAVRPAGPAAPVPVPLAPAIADRVRTAAAACAGIKDAIAASPAPLGDVAGEVDGLLATIRANAARAQQIHAFLAEAPAAEPAVLARVRARLDGLLAEIDHVVATLQTVRAEILAAEGDEPPGLAPSLAGQVAELRVKARILSTGLEESLAETRSSARAGVDRATQGP